MRATRARLDRAARRRHQRQVYKALAPRFSAIYQELAPLEEESFSTPYWSGINARIAERLLPLPPADFLRDPLIIGNLFADSPGRWLEEELAYLRRRLQPRDLQRRLEEDVIGRPSLIRSGLRTSHNTIHHTYHLERYREATGDAPERFGTVVEWGGGYGNLAKLITRAGPAGRTYLIIDNPLLLALQWLYLSCTLGESAVRIVPLDGVDVEPGKVNLVPTALAELIRGMKAELFVSTWALSECAAAAQDFVANLSWFGAPHLLLAYQDDSGDFPHATRVRLMLGTDGTATESIDFLPGNHYLFR